MNKATRRKESAAWRLSGVGKGTWPIVKSKSPGTGEVRSSALWVEKRDTVLGPLDHLVGAGITAEKKI